MKLSIYLHTAELSLSPPVSVLDSFGVQRCRTTVHDWVRKADLQPRDGTSPNRIAADDLFVADDAVRVDDAGPGDAGGAVAGLPGVAAVLGPLRIRVVLSDAFIRTGVNISV